LPLIGNVCPGLGIGRHRNIEKQSIIMLIDMIHEAGHEQPLGDGIAELRRSYLAGQRPVDGQAQPGIARIVPIAVPALVGLHEQRERHLAARRRAHRLGHERGMDVKLRAELRVSRLQGQQRQQQRKSHEKAMECAHAKNQIFCSVDTGRSCRPRRLGSKGEIGQCG
jgi:hypothetical protein